MARATSKKSSRKVSKKASVRTPAIEVPDYSGTLVESENLILINKDGVDYNTDVEEFAAGVGAELGIDTLVTAINEELGDPDTTGEGDSIRAHIYRLEHGGGGSGDLDGIVENEKNIEENKAAIDANTEEIARQASWTGTPDLGTNSSTTHAEQIVANTEAIARLQGALVYRGGVNIVDEPPEKNPDNDEWEAGDFVSSAGTTDSPHASWNAPSHVEAGDYFSFNGKIWGPCGSNGTVIPPINDGSLSIQSADNGGLKVTNGTGFSANTTANIDTELAIDLNLEGGLEISDDGIGIKVDDSSGSSLLVTGDGIAVNPDFVSGIAGDGAAPGLDAVLTTSNESSQAIEAGAFKINGLTAANQQEKQSASDVLLKDISKLPSLP